MSVTFQEVHTPLWIDRILAYDATIPDEWVCDITALRVDEPHPAPSAEALGEFLSRDRSLVVVAAEASEVLGYVIADDDAAYKGGCRGRWVGTTSAAVLQGLLDVLCDRYGWVWGRITNPVLQEAMVSFGCVTERFDPLIYTYRKDD